MSTEQVGSSEQTGNLALVNARIYTGRRDDPVVEDGVILVRDGDGAGRAAGVIRAVGRAAEVEVPAGCRQVDLGGRWVLPGFINAHCHLSSSGQPMKLFRLVSENEVLARRLVRLLRTGFGKRLVLRMMAANARNALHAGVTTLRAMGDLGFVDVKLRKQIDRGDRVGPRLLVSGQAVVPTGGHGSFVGVTADCDTEIKKVVRSNAREEVDWIKIISTNPSLCVSAPLR